MPRKKKVTLPMIAEKLGLSVYTVSKALRGLPGMSEETRREVIRTAREFGYLTKDQEKTLIYEGIPKLYGKQRRFLLVTSSTTSYSVSQLFFGLKDRLNELGHKIDIAFLPLSLNVEQFAEWTEKEGILYADGIFISPIVSETMEKLLLELPLPRILINFPPVGAKVDSVIWDVYDAAWQAVQYLSANGHRQIMYFGDTVKTRGYKQRWLAFREAMKREGIEVCEESHLIRWPLSGSIPSEHVEWAEQFRMSLERSQTTALICAPYGHLPWIFYACSEAGLRIPQDISVIMLDNCRESFMQDVTRPEFLEMETGFRAADRMLWRIANPHMPFEHIRLQGTFYEGATVMKKQQA